MPEHIGNTARLSLKRDEDAHGQKISPSARAAMPPAYRLHRAAKSA
jgi:hypothetical protein